MLDKFITVMNKEKLERYIMLFNGRFDTFELDDDDYRYAFNEICEIIESTNKIKDKPVLKKMIKFPLL